MAGVQALTDGNGADVVVDAVGRPETFTQAVSTATACPPATSLCSSTCTCRAGRLPLEKTIGLDDVDANRFACGRSAATRWVAGYGPERFRWRHPDNVSSVQLAWDDCVGHDPGGGGVIESFAVQPAPRPEVQG